MEKLKIGVFGLFRGMEYVRQFTDRQDTVVYAICDKDQEAVEEAKKVTGPEVKVCATYEELLRSGIQAVYLANYFCDHARCAIAAMEQGIDVLSECTAAPTMAECVALWECVERTGRKYMLAENENSMKDIMELKTIYDGGTQGKVLYAEGEYNHYMDKESRKYSGKLSTGEYHWRKYLPRTYYLTHSLGPLMYITGEKPVSVQCMVAANREFHALDRPMDDAYASMQCMTDGGAIFRFTGCTNIVGNYRFRIVGEKAASEISRGYNPGSRDRVGLIYKDYLVPEGQHAVNVYDCDFPPCDEEIGEGSHGGADWWVAKAFADYVLRDKAPCAMDYKSAIVMSMTAILGWRSVLEGGKTLPIPDLSDPAQRDLYREDWATPFPNPDGTGDIIPCSTHQIQ